MTRTLWLHMGLYKAGSSFLQSALHDTRGALQTAGVFWPASPWDAEMERGEISPGNAFPLVQALMSEDEDRCVTLLAAWAAEAQNKACSRVLASAEALVHQCIRAGRLELLVAAARRAGFDEVHVLGFVRDLADHAMSTYKHRGKPGHIPDLVAWVERDYETPQVLRDLLARMGEERPLTWTLRRYEKDSRWLLDATFGDWLGLDAPQNVAKQSVNASLTLSEIELMVHTRPRFPRVMDLFVDRLKRLPMADKARDAELERWTYAALRAALEPHQSLVETLSSHLPDGEALRLGRDLDTALLSAPRPPAVLSSAQLEAYADALGFLTSSSGHAMRLRRRAVQVLPERVTRSMLALAGRQMGRKTSVL